MRAAQLFDSDGYGDDNDAVTEYCDPSSGMVQVQGDCNDSDPLAYADSSGVCAEGTSCEAILNSGTGTTSGVYTVDPDGPGGSDSPFDSYCDQNSDGGGWALLLSASASSTYWGNNSSQWSTAGSDLPPYSLQFSTWPARVAASQWGHGSCSAGKTHSLTSRANLVAANRGSRPLD